MRITIKRLEELRACQGGPDMYRRFPGLDEDGSADLRELCLWACREGVGKYAWWLLPRLMPPMGAAEWAIRCARTVRSDETWLAWADGWLSGAPSARSKAAAEAASAVAWSDASAWAALAAEAAAAVAWSEAEASARAGAVADAAEAAARQAASAAARYAVSAETADEMIGLAIQIIDREKGV